MFSWNGSKGNACVDRRVDRLIEACVVIYIATIFTRWGEVPTTVAWIGAIAWAFLARKPYLAAFARDRISLLWLSLLAWALISALWSANGAVTLATWYASFDDHLLLVPLMVHVSFTGRGNGFLRIFAWASVVIIALNALQYVGDIRKETIDVAGNWVEHRKWAYPLVIFSSFLMVQVIKAQGRKRLWWGGLLLVSALMVLASGSRGAWLALIIAAVIFGGWMLLRGQRRTVLIVFTLLTLALVTAMILPQGKIVKQRLAEGFSTSNRVSGTWGPALEMAMQRPWLGHGFGPPIYIDEYRRQQSRHPHWSLDRPMYPHNFFLMTLFGLGIPGLLLTLLLSYHIVKVYSARTRTPLEGQDALLPIALLASFVAHYAVRGSFETLSWKPMAMYVGIAIALSLGSMAQKTRME